jgi:hypothetical protein
MATTTKEVAPARGLDTIPTRIIVAKIKDGMIAVTEAVVEETITTNRTRAISHTDTKVGKEASMADEAEDTEGVEEPHIVVAEVIVAVVVAGTGVEALSAAEVVFREAEGAINDAAQT